MPVHLAAKLKLAVPDHLPRNKKGSPFRLPNKLSIPQNYISCQYFSDGLFDILRSAHEFYHYFMKYSGLQYVHRRVIIQAQRGDTNVQVNFKIRKKQSDRKKDEGFWKQTS